MVIPGVIVLEDEDIQNKVSVASIVDKMRKAILEWFGHMKRRSIDKPMRRCETLIIESMRNDRGRPKKC